MISDNRKITRGVICTLAGGLCWGFSGACGQLLVQQQNMGTPYVTLIRMLCAGVILTLVNIIKKKKTAFDIFKRKNNIFRMILFAVLGLIGSQFTYLMAITYSNAGTATVLQYIGPIFIMIFVCITSRRLPDRYESLSVFLAFFGVVLLATHGDFTELKLSKECLWWGLLAAVSLMLYSLLPKKLIDEYGSAEVTGFGMLIGGIVLLIVLRPDKSVFDLSLKACLALSGMVLVGTVLSYPLYLQGVSDIGSVKASMIACIEPVSATVFSVLWFKTQFVPIDIIGFIMILSTVFLLSVKKRQ